MKRKETLDKIEKGMMVEVNTNQFNSTSLDSWDARKKQSLKFEDTIRKTGMVDIFEGIRDRGIVKLNESSTIVHRKIGKLFRGIEVRKELNYMPAGVVISGDQPMVSLFFDEDRSGSVVTQKYISAFVHEGKLFVRGEEFFEVGKVSVDEAIVEALKKPLIETKGSRS